MKKNVFLVALSLIFLISGCNNVKEDIDIKKESDNSVNKDVDLDNKKNKVDGIEYDDGFVITAEEFKNLYNTTAKIIKIDEIDDFFYLEDYSDSLELYRCELGDYRIYLNLIKNKDEDNFSSIVLNTDEIDTEEKFQEFLKFSFGLALTCDPTINKIDDINEKFVKCVMNAMKNEEEDQFIETDKFNYACFYKNNELAFYVLGHKPSEYIINEQEEFNNFVEKNINIKEESDNSVNKDVDLDNKISKVDSIEYNNGFVITIEEFKNLYNINAKILEIDEIDDFFHEETDSSELYSCRLGNYKTYLNLIKLKDEDNFLGILLNTDEFDTEEKLQEFLIFSFGLALTCDPTVIKIDNVKDKFVKGIVNAIKNEEEAQFIESDKFTYTFMYSDNGLTFYVLGNKTIESIENDTKSEIEQPTEYEFTAGIYTVGEDIPKGKYDVEWVSGSGGCYAGDMIETFGNEEYRIKTFNNLSLKSGETIEVTGRLKIKFIRKN